MLKITKHRSFFSPKGLWTAIKSYQTNKDGMKIIPSEAWNKEFEGSPSVGYSRLHKHLSHLFYYRDLTLKNKLEKQPDRQDIYDKFHSNHYKKLYADQYSNRPAQIYFNKNYLNSNEFLENMNSGLAVDDKKEEKYLKDKENSKKMQKFA
jgi:hypothetical protein